MLVISLRLEVSSWDNGLVVHTLEAANKINVGDSFTFLGILAIHKMLMFCYYFFYICVTRCISLWTSFIACVKFQHCV